MRGKKNMRFRNALGQEVVFDNRTLFLESIDMLGTPGIHTTESLAGADGQRTVSHQLGAKTIPCGLAIRDVGDVEWIKRRLTEVFFPKLNGTMTVRTLSDTYHIDCYPVNVPSFRMAENDGVWRFDVDFVADYPYWKKGKERTLAFPDASTSSLTYKSNCPFEICPEVYFPAYITGSTVLSVNGKAIAVDAHDFPIKLTTERFSMINTLNGESCTNYLSPSEDIGNLRVRYGTNTIQLVSGVPVGITMSFHQLSMGEI